MLVIRIIVYLLEIILCYIIQSAMFPYISLFGVMPNLLLILVVSTAYMKGRTTGLLIGFFSGLLVDLVFGNVIGLYALIYMLIGYIIGFVHPFYSNDDFTLPLLFVAAGNFIYGFCFYVFEFLLRGRLNFFYYLRRFILPEIIYTVAVSVLIYKLLHKINNYLDRKLQKEE